MPYRNGKRISVAEWLQLRPDRIDHEAGAWMAHHLRVARPDGLDEPEEGPEHIRARSSRTDSAAMFVIADALGVSPSELTDVEFAEVGDRAVQVVGGDAYRPWDVPDEPEDNSEARNYLTAAEYEPTGATESPETATSERPQPREERTDRYEAEREATKWSEAMGLPKHRPNRPSQVQPAPHLRYVRGRAREWNVTEKVADSRITSHPPECPYQVPS